MGTTPDFNRQQLGVNDMELTSKQIYNSIMHGAQTVIKNKEVLNRINVFPVRDGDTGSNLSSMMRTIIRESKQKRTVKETLESIADAALSGARGNSGIIFAQYFSGLSESVHDLEQISIEAYAGASSIAACYAYEAIEKPVHGTMITLMQEWGNALVEETKSKKTVQEIFSNAYKRIESALEATKDQLEVLKKANVVDSGAKGFTYFLEGALYYIETGKEVDLSEHTHGQSEASCMEMHEEEHGNEKFRYCTECLLENEEIDLDSLKDFLSNMGDSTVIAANKKKCRIHIHTDDPAEVFDFLHEKGTVVYQKIDDMIKQKEVVSHRKHAIALVTDSIADLPKALIDEQQIHIVYLDVLFRDRVYMDRLTIKPERLLDLSKESDKLPTSSQPSPKQVENLFDYLSTYYESVIVMAVSKELSGTYNSFKKAAEQYNQEDFLIHVIDTKQNSGAQGLLVKKCAELINQNMTFEEVVKRIETQIPYSKILVQVKNLDNMIKSGRLSVKVGNLGKRIGMKPIVTLDEQGKGALESIAFSNHGSNKKIINHLKRLIKKSRIETYAICHINNRQGAEELKELAVKILGCEPAYIEETSSIVAVGAGQGAVALAYILEKEGP